MFVSVSNPDGIQHHGGQMAWDAVSDDRVVMMTYTKDNKALIQEINNSGGTPVVGPASFIASTEVLAGSVVCLHRPRICAIKGTDKVVILMPTAYSALNLSSEAYAGIYNANIYFKRAAGDVTPEAPRAALPITFTLYLLQRDTGGLYKVLDNFAISHRSISGYTYDIRGPINIEMNTTTSVTVRFYYTNPTRLGGGLQTAIHNFTVGDKLTYTTNNSSALYTTSTAVMYHAYGHKKTRDRKGVYGDILMFANDDGLSAVSKDYWLYQTPSIRPGPQGGSTEPMSGTIKGDTNSRATLGSHVIYDKSVTGSYYATGHTASGQNTLYKNAAFTYLGNTKPVYCPIDTGFVTQDIVCIVGGTETNISQAETTAQNDLDLAYSLASKLNGSVRPVRLSFRMLTGGGHYAGPFDPVTLPYWYADTTNNFEILHKVSDTNFWLIGCWMANQSATPQIGVISVKPPAA